MTHVLVYASQRALREAEQLGLDRPLEVLVEEAVHGGAKRRYLPPRVARRAPPLEPGERSVLLCDGTIAVCSRGTGHITTRKAWHVTRLISRQRPRTYTEGRSDERADQT